MVDSDSSLSKVAKQLKRHYETLITGDLHPVDHSVAKGDAREHGWRKLLSNFLPDRYAVKSGFIIDSSGQLSEQIDCVIYRKDVSIKLYAVDHHIVIPVEAVFGAFEVKPSINWDSLKYAEKKAGSVAKLNFSTLLSGQDYWANKLKGNLKIVSADGQIVFGLLADKLESENKAWETPTFKELILKQSKKISVLMTIEDGGVDTFGKGLPINEYHFCKGDHAILNQLIRLVTTMVHLEKTRQPWLLQSCCLTQYTKQLDKPIKVEVET